MKIPALACLLGLLGTAAWAAPTEVVFVNPAAFADSGDSDAEREANLRTLARYIRDAGQRLLPPGEALRVEVLDVDLAGEVKPLRNGEWLRLVSGRADWPQIRVRYSLGGRSAEVRLEDMHYTRGLPVGRNPAPLVYEKRMLERWIRSLAPA